MNWAQILGIGLFVSGMQLAMPTALAAVGEAFSERAGVLNLGLEGMMLGAALASFAGEYYAHSATVGVLCGVGVGVLIGGLQALLSVYLKTDQVINGIVIVIFVQGITAFSYERLFRTTKVSPEVPSLPHVRIPGLGGIPWLGAVLFNQNVLFYISFVLALSVWVALYRTRFGLWVRAAGESPQAADSVGVSVDFVRTLALLLCGAMAGFGGAVLIVGDINLFGLNVTAGRGWVAIALVIFGRWNPFVVFGGALLFGITDALQLRIQAASGGSNSAIPFEAFQALPYVLALVVMVIATVTARRSAQPSALGIPFRKGVTE